MPFLSLQKILASAEQVSGTNQDFGVTGGGLLTLHGNPKRTEGLRCGALFPFTTPSICHCSPEEAFSDEPGGQGCALGPQCPSLRDATWSRPPAALDSHGHARVCIHIYPCGFLRDISSAHCALLSLKCQREAFLLSTGPRAASRVGLLWGTLSASGPRPAQTRWLRVSGVLRTGFVSPGPDRAGTGFIRVPLHPEPSAEPMEGASKHGLHHGHQSHGDITSRIFPRPKLLEGGLRPGGVK